MIWAIHILQDAVSADRIAQASCSMQVDDATRLLGILHHYLPSTPLLVTPLQLQRPSPTSSSHTIILGGQRGALAKTSDHNRIQSYLGLVLSISRFCLVLHSSTCVD